jgi:zinc transporter ZupT
MHYIITFLAVMLGYALAWTTQPKKKKHIKLLLAFSGAFLLSLTVMHLLPELFHAEHHAHEGHTHSQIPVGAYIMFGIILQIVLEFFSKGAEHGHVHLHGSHEEEMPFQKMPWLLFGSLCLHALLEGLPIYQNNHLAYGIGIHHFPIAMILTIFFRQSGLKNWTIFGFMLGFALMTPIGTYLAEHLHFMQHYSRELTAVVVGILFHISSTIIFESNEGHKFNLAKISMILLGFALAYLMESGHAH